MIFGRPSLSAGSSAENSIEVNFPEVFLDYLHHDVDCVLFSSFSHDPMFGDSPRPRRHQLPIVWCLRPERSAAQRRYAQRRHRPHGTWLDQSALVGSTDLVGVTLDRNAPQLRTALHAARPGRATARDVTIYQRCRVNDPRSRDRTVG